MPSADLSSEAAGVSAASVCVSVAFARLPAASAGVSFEEERASVAAVASLAVVDASAVEDEESSWVSTAASA